MFTLLIGGLVKTVGYDPFFVALAVFDILGAIWLWAVVRERVTAAGGGRAMIRNPILPGFNPDPSILRVGDDYYIATSTFEWYPGVQIHHSRDLVNWRLLTRPLRRASQLNMLGDPDSCGVWAPCLTYSDGLFWLVYTDVKRYGRTTVGGASGASLRDFHNYLVTCPTIDGEWSDAVYLNSSGFDPSLFHDDDGRKYLVNQLWDHRPGRNRFAGIVLQEYSHAQRKLIGERQQHLQGHGHRLHRSAASLQAQRLLLPDHRRGRHGLGSRDDDGAFALADRAVRAASRQVHRHRAGSSRMRRCIAPVTATWWRRRRAIPTPSIYADGRCPTAAAACSAARPRSRRWPGEAMTGCARSMAADCPSSRRRRRHCPPRRSLPRRDSRGLRRRSAAHRLPVVALAVSRGIVQPERAPRVPAAVWPRNHRQHFPAVTGGASPAGALLQRDHRDGVRAGALPAVGRAGVLLQLGEVPLSARVARRGARPAPARDVVRAGLCRSPMPSRPRSRFRRAASNCASEVDYERLRFAYRIGGRLELAAGVVRRQHPVR